MDDFFQISIETQLFLERTSARTVARTTSKFLAKPVGYDPSISVVDHQAAAEVLDG